MAHIDADLAVLREQLGRPARGVVGIAARCVCGNPTVVATSPRLPDGTPFPTFYYLTHPAATAAMSMLEADHVMRELSDLLTEDEEVREAYRAAHEAYLRSYGERLVDLHLHDIRLEQDHLAPGQGQLAYAWLAPYARPDVIQTVELSPRVPVEQVPAAVDALLAAGIGAPAGT